MEMVIWIVDLLGILLKLIKDGMKYLGFQLKSKGYSSVDWHWILERFFRKISAWEQRALSLARRFIMSQLVLTQLAVYWSHIYSLLASIILKINRLLANFIWGGSSNQVKIHLMKLEMISMPKKYGGWGPLDMRSFGRELL